MRIESYQGVLGHIKQLVKKEKNKKLESAVNKKIEPIAKVYPNLVKAFITDVSCLLVVLDLTEILSFNLAE